MNLSGHVWTVGALVGRAVVPATPPLSERWATEVADPDMGTVRLSGRLTRPRAAREVAVLVHGLGGSSDSGYMVRAASAASELGLASLRLSLRGADGEDGDFYHGGLTADLHAAVGELALDGFDRIVVLGFSLGGHIVLRFASETESPEVRAVAAVCSPLDLGAGADALDRPLMAPYRRYVLGGLRANYERTARFRRAPIPSAKLHAIRTIRQWDSLTVVPRFGFRDPDDYYARASVGPRLVHLRRPALLVAAEHDPVIPPVAVRPTLDRLDPHSDGAGRLTVRWLRSGGHVGFPRGLDLGYGERRGYLAQCLQWLLGVGP